MVDPPSDRSDSVLPNEITKEVIGLAFQRLLLPHSYHSLKKMETQEPGSSLFFWQKFRLENKKFALRSLELNFLSFEIWEQKNSDN